MNVNVSTDYKQTAATLLQLKLMSIQSIIYTLSAIDTKTGESRDDHVQSLALLIIKICWLASSRWLTIVMSLFFLTSHCTSALQ